MAFLSRTDFQQLSAIPADVFADLVAIDNGATVDAEIAAGESKIKGYIGSRYSFPISPVSPDLKQANADISAWLLMTHYGFQITEQGADADSAFRSRYEDAVSWCKDVSRGIVTLDIESGPSADLTSEAICVSQSPRGF